MATKLDITALGIHLTEPRPGLARLRFPTGGPAQYFRQVRSTEKFHRGEPEEWFIWRDRLWVPLMELRRSA